MLPLDSYVRKRARNRKHRSEAEPRLYWSMYQKMADKAPAPRWKSPAWMGMHWVLIALRKEWPERVQPGMRVSEDGLPTPPLFSKEGKV